MNCAATEMNRLRVGASVLRRAPSKEVCRSPDTPPTPPPSSPPPPPPPPQPQAPLQMRAQQRQEKTRSTTGTLTSLLHIQLAQINRMSEAVRIEVGWYKRLVNSLRAFEVDKQKELTFGWKQDVLYPHLDSRLALGLLVHCTIRSPPKN